MDGLGWDGMGWETLGEKVGRRGWKGREGRGREKKGKEVSKGFGVLVGRLVRLDYWRLSFVPKGGAHRRMGLRWYVLLRFGDDRVGGKRGQCGASGRWGVGVIKVRKGWDWVEGSRFEAGSDWVGEGFFILRDGIDAFPT